MSTPVVYAYHVTKESGQQPPNWTELEARSIVDRYYNGAIADIVSKGVFFSTTLFGGTLPYKTLYPTDGTPGRYYWRMEIPLTTFQNYRIIKCHSQMTNSGVEQVALLLVDPGNQELNTKINQAIQKRQMQDITNVSNPYLCRNQTGQWFSNNYGSPEKVWVNFLISHNVLIDSDQGCRWHKVEHM